MVGLRRLDDPQARVETIVRDGVEGDLIEARDLARRRFDPLRATLDALGDGDPRSASPTRFQGFPAADEQFEHAVDYLAVPVEDVRANFARLGYEQGLRFVAGFFEDTLPDLAGERWSLLRLDGDTYEATRTTLRGALSRSSAGGYLIVDDHGALEDAGARSTSSAPSTGSPDPLEEVDWTCVHWRRTSEATVVPAPAPTHAADRAGARGGARAAGRHVATIPERT